MEDRSLYPIPDEEVYPADRASFVTSSDGALRSIRREPPADFAFKLEDFSSLPNNLSQLGNDSYVSCIFETGGYKWKMSLYPDGDKKRGGDGYLSLYLVFVDTNNFLHDWEVNVNLIFFVYDHIRNQYMTIADVIGKKTRVFHKMKTQHGFTKLVSLAILHDESNGYLKNDTCILGAEVYVIGKNRTHYHRLSMFSLTRLASTKMSCSLNRTHYHCLSMFSPTRLASTKMSCSLSNFSKLHKDRYYIDVLSARGRKWKFEIYPRGDRGNKGRLSVYLHSVDSDFMNWKRVNVRFYVYFMFQVRDQLHGNHLKETVIESLSSNWTTSTPIKCGNLMLLTDLTDPSKGFLVNDKLIVECGYCVLWKVENT